MTVADAMEKETDARGKSEAQNLERATAKLLRRITAEPAYKAVLYKILVYCDPARSCADVERTILSFPEMKNALPSPQTLLSWLVESGGIEQVTADKNEPVWCTTAAGRNVVGMESGENRLGRLLARETVYHDTYLQILQFCVLPKSRKEIESALEGNPVLEHPKVYASFFIEALEEAGGLEWNEKWETTQAGRDFLDRRQ